VGIYVPGGRAVYISTLIMCAVPARIAGVAEIVVATTPAAAARPEFQYACSRMGVSQVYRAGGAAGVAALALGTGTLERVDKIVGPGNSYVTAAKSRLVGEVGIDMTAGPTELIVIADETADVDCVVADLLAQAEHGADSAVICLATSREIADLVEKGAAGGGGAPLVLVANTSDAIEFVNRVAPEHLSICTRDAEALAERVENCGAIFLGRSSPVAAGDYIVGSNHVLPTAGSARFFSPLGVYDFVKRSNIINAGERDLERLIEPGRHLAEFEGLPLHGASLMARATVRTS
jgi:histidinol dehydrogenase